MINFANYGKRKNKDQNSHREFKHHDVTTKIYCKIVIEYHFYINLYERCVCIFPKIRHILITNQMEFDSEGLL